MTNEEARLLYSVWEAVQEYIPTNQRNDAAEQLVRALVDAGNDLDLLHEVEGECPYLDKALAAVAADEEEEIDDLDDYERNDQD